MRTDADERRQSHRGELGPQHAVPGSRERRQQHDEVDRAGHDHHRDEELKPLHPTHVRIVAKGDPAVQYRRRQRRDGEREDVGTDELIEGRVRDQERRSRRPRWRRRRPRHSGESAVSLQPAVGRTDVNGRLRGGVTNGTAPSHRSWARSAGAVGGGTSGLRDPTMPVARLRPWPGTTRTVRRCRTA